MGVYKYIFLTLCLGILLRAVDWYSARMRELLIGHTSLANHRREM